MSNRRRISMDSSAPVEEVFKRFILSKKAYGIAVKTLQSYEHHLIAIRKHLDVTMMINELKKSDLEAMTVSMRDAGLASNTIRTYTATLKSFFSWCREQEINNLDIPLYKAEETIKETYTDAELLVLLKKPSIRECTFAEHRNWVIINLLINNGCRAATVLKYGI